MDGEPPCMVEVEASRSRPRGRKRRRRSRAVGPVPSRERPLQSVDPDTRMLPASRSPSRAVGPGPSREQPPQSVGPDTRMLPASRSPSRAVGPGPSGGRPPQTIEPNTGMSRTVTQEEAEAPGSRSTERKQRRPTPARRRGGMPTPAGISLFRSVRWVPAARDRATAKELSRKRKRSRADIGLEERGRKSKRNAGHQEWVAAAAARASTDAEAAASASTAAEEELATAAAAALASTAASAVASASTAPISSSTAAALAARTSTAAQASASASTAAEEELAMAALASTAKEEEVEAVPASPAAAATAAEEEEEVMAAAASDSTATGEVEEVPAPTAAEAYVPNSPIHAPYILEYDSSGEEACESTLDMDPALFHAYRKAKVKYLEKLDRQMELPTLDEHVPLSGLTDQFLPVRESATNTILQASKFVLGLSTYIDGKLFKQCSGILIDWSEGTGTILTSAHLIRLRSPNVDEWLGGQEYAPDTEVYVQLLDGSEKGRLMYYHKHYDFALINVPMDRPAKLACFSNEVKFAQDIFLLGRDERFNLQISNGRVLYKGPGSYDRHHYVYTDCEVRACGTGGPVIDFNGEVMGMVNYTAKMAFIPCSIILKCLHLWRTINCVPRIHLGLKLSAIKFLDLPRLEKISRKCNVDAGLIVEEVSGGSIAEKLGVRLGDIIQSVNGECVATTIELENVLLHICENHFEKHNGLDSNVDVVVGIFYTSKRVHGRIKLTANVSDDVEIIKSGEYPISARGLSASTSFDKAGSVDSGDNFFTAPYSNR